MHPLMLQKMIASCRERIAQGDCPTTPPFPLEQLEEAVVQLAAATRYAAPAAVPPREPTKEMKAAAYVLAFSDHWEQLGVTATEVWQAMYNAAPVEQAAAVERDARDAARYRWLKENRGGDRSQPWAMVFDANLENHIDAAIAEQAKERT